MHVVLKPFPYSLDGGATVNEAVVGEPVILPQELLVGLLAEGFVTAGDEKLENTAATGGAPTTSAATTAPKTAATVAPTPPAPVTPPTPIQAPTAAPTGAPDGQTLDLNT